jgi:hypothetical protein
MEDEKKKEELDRALLEVAKQIQEIHRISEEFQQKVVDRNLNITAEPPLCSFCGKGKNQVRHMIEGRNAFICDQCISQCQELISQL